MAAITGKSVEDRLIEELVNARFVLEQGRKLGIVITATEEVVSRMRQSTHPQKDRVIANLCPAT